MNQLCSFCPPSISWMVDSLCEAFLSLELSLLVWCLELYLLLRIWTSLEYKSLVRIGLCVPTQNQSSLLGFDIFEKILNFWYVFYTLKHLQREEIYIEKFENVMRSKWRLLESSQGISSGVVKGTILAIHSLINAFDPTYRLLLKYWLWVNLTFRILPATGKP